MSLDDRIVLINQMIKEDSDNTVRDYLNFLKELEEIENTIRKRA